MYFKEICRYIVAAQIASDGGKEIYDLMSYLPKTWQDGYDAKDGNIAKAIKIINTTKPCGINYYYGKGDGVAPVIIYFNIKTDKGYKQVSFHSFNKAFAKMIGKGQKTSWRYSTSSRENCEFLINHYDLFKEKTQDFCESTEKVDLNAAKQKESTKRRPRRGDIKISRRKRF